MVETQPEQAQAPAQPLTPVRTTKGCALQLLGVVLVAALAYGAWGAYERAQASSAAQAHQEEVRRELEPAIKKMTQASAPAGDASAAASAQAYDIDKTVRVIHEIDQALKQHKDLKSYLLALGKQDYRGVAPEVLAARAELLEIILRLYAQQVALEDQQAAWEVTSQVMLTVLSAVNVNTGSGGLPGALLSGQFSIDQQKIEAALAETKARHEQRQQLLGELRQVEGELLKATIKYAQTYYKYLDQWDRLCVFRDRAYLAMYNQDWEAAHDAADKAIQLSPTEAEAHLIKALALIELSKAQGDGGPMLSQQASALLNQYIQDHPDRSAPAFLLQGVLAASNGQEKEARLALQQAATYYPKQAQRLGDMLDPYKMRDFLKKTREGSLILEQYKATMLGAGYFSPDLQMARMSFDAGDFKAGQAKVLDHFSRRRAQAQWDFILSDVVFGERFLGAHWRKLFPEEPYLDLKVEPSLMGSKLGLAVYNRSDRTLHNATLILALRVTDMHREDYHTISAERTVPAILPKEETDFGDVEVKLELFGKPKTTGDIVQHRAILISDDAISWVDTDEYKLAALKEVRQQRWYQQAAEQQARKGQSWLKVMGQDPQALQQQLSQQSKLKIEHELGKDAVHIQVPAPLALLRPFFTLRHGDKRFSPQVNVLDAKHIKLTFEGVENFEAKDLKALPLELEVDGLFGGYKLQWQPGQELPSLVSPSAD